MPNQPVMPKRVLIVDDEATLLFFLQQSLQETLAGCQVEIAASGDQAVQLLHFQPFDLLITDLKMAGVDGFTVAKAARALYPAILVILMTAHGSRDIKEEANNLRVDAYLAKPFPTAQLQVLVQRLFSANDYKPDLVGNPAPSLETHNQA